ncbi:MAG: hypothetical protein H7Y38_08050, partial [Armatimonadetes bacterium]|nr:hypothetical protein [Armatimonadota bacterium]
LVAALRHGWEFPERGESGKYANGGGANKFVPVPFSPPKMPENRGEIASETAPKPVTAPASAPDPLEGLTPEKYNALSDEAEAQIRAENPFFGRLGAPRLPRPAVRDRMRKLILSKQSEAEEHAIVEALYAEDDYYEEPFTNF